jgi:hypothetical protein
MKDELIEEVIKNLNKSLIDKGSFIKINNSEPVKINKSSFHEIKEFDVEEKIIFIDGGNAEILTAPNFSLQIIRVYYTIYLENKRIENKNYEFYLLISSFDKKGELFFKTQIFGDKLIENFEISSFDKTIIQGINRGDISFIGNIARRFAELNLAKKFKNEIIILDGSLELKYQGEQELLEELYKNDIIGISKTCELFTDKGNSAFSLLRDLQPKNEWYCYPIVKSKEKYDTLFVKLNEKSDYIFRIDFSCLEKLEKILSLLKSNSKDPIFLGYPYGLIEADKFARISNKELELLKTRFIIKAGKDWGKINEFLKAKDGHSVLDHIS